jgi:hypothetical protein
MPAAGTIVKPCRLNTLSMSPAATSASVNSETSGGTKLESVTNSNRSSPAPAELKIVKLPSTRSSPDCTATTFSEKLRSRAPLGGRHQMKSSSLVPTDRSSFGDSGPGVAEPEVENQNSMASSSAMASVAGDAMLVTIKMTPIVLVQRDGMMDQRKSVPCGAQQFRSRSSSIPPEFNVLLDRSSDCGRLKAEKVGSFALRWW